MSSIPESTWVEWRRKRRNATIGYIIYGCVTGMDYSIIFSTLYFYLTKMIKCSNAEFYYGFIICIYCISSSLFGGIAARLVDKTRRVSRYINIITVIQIIGCLIYVVPYSVVYPIIARFLIGSGESFGDVCAGEVIRIYDERKGTRALYWISSSYTVGFIIAPAINLLYININFHIFSVPVNYLNFGGIFMAILLTIMLVINNTLVHDCSAIIDYKEYLKHKKKSSKSHTNKAVDVLNESSVESTPSTEKETSKQEDIPKEVPVNDDKSNENINDCNQLPVLVVSESEDRSNAIPVCTESTPDVIPNSDPTLLSSSCPVSETDDSSEYSSDGGIIVNLCEIKSISSFRLKRNKKCLTEYAKSKPIPMKKVLKVLLTNPDSLIILLSGIILTYSLFATDILLPMIIHDLFHWKVSIVMFVYLAYGILSLIVLLLMSKLCLSGRKIYYVTIICLISVILQFAVTAAIKLTNRKLANDVVLLSLQLIFSVFGWCLLDVLLRSLMSKMVPSSIQSFTEVFRAMTARASVLIASLTGPFLIPYLHWWGFVTIVTMTIILCFFLFRRKHFISIKEIAHFQEQVLEADSHQSRTA